MEPKRVRWESMDKKEIQLAWRAEHYVTTCGTEGKTAATIRGYREQFDKFNLWNDGVRLSGFAVELARVQNVFGSGVPRGAMTSRAHQQVVRHHNACTRIPFDFQPDYSDFLPARQLHLEPNWELQAE